MSHYCFQTNKQIFHTEQAAKIELAFYRMAANNGNEQAKQVRYYNCPHCKKWHLTSKKRFIERIPKGETK